MNPPFPPQRPGVGPRPIRMTPDQAAELKRRKVWLASHAAPDGFALVSVEEMDVILRGIQNSSALNAQLQAGLKSAHKMIEEMSRVADSSERFVEAVKALESTEEGADLAGLIKGIAEFGSLGHALHNLGHYLEMKNKGAAAFAERARQERERLKKTAEAASEQAAKNEAGADVLKFPEPPAGAEKK